MKGNIKKAKKEIEFLEKMILQSYTLLRNKEPT